MPSTEHLKAHQYAVPKGQEPLSKKPISVRLYESDDLLIRAKGNEAGLFVRNAVRLALQKSQ